MSECQQEKTITVKLSNTSSSNNSHSKLLVLELDDNNSTIAVNPSAARDGNYVLRFSANGIKFSVSVPVVVIKYLVEDSKTMLAKYGDNLKWG